MSQAQNYSFSLVSDIEAFDARFIAVGAQAYAVSTNAFYTLEVSSESVDHVSVLSVLGIGGLRWKLSAPLAAVATDATLTGTGTSGDPLKVAVPAGAIVTDATLTGAGTSGSHLGVAVPVDTGTVITVGTATDSVTFSSLNGDVDGDYEIAGSVVLPGAVTNSLRIEPNHDGSNLQSGSLYSIGGVSSAATIGWLVIERGLDVAPGYVQFVCRISSKSGKWRQFQCICTANDSTNVQRTSITTGFWRDTTSNLVSITLVSDIVGGAATGIGVGSRIVLRKLGVST